MKISGNFVFSAFIFACPLPCLDSRNSSGDGKFRHNREIMPFHPSSFIKRNLICISNCSRCIRNQFQCHLKTSGSVFYVFKYGCRDYRCVTVVGATLEHPCLCLQSIIIVEILIKIVLHKRAFINGFPPEFLAGLIICYFHIRICIINFSAVIGFSHNDLTGYEKIFPFRIWLHPLGFSIQPCHVHIPYPEIRINKCVTVARYQLLTTCVQPIQQPEGNALIRNFSGSIRCFYK